MAYWHEVHTQPGVPFLENILTTREIFKHFVTRYSMKQT